MVGGLYPEGGWDGGLTVSGGLRTGPGGVTPGLGVGGVQPGLLGATVGGVTPGLAVGGATPGFAGVVGGVTPGFAVGGVTPGLVGGAVGGATPGLAVGGATPGLVGTAVGGATPGLVGAAVGGTPGLAPGTMGGTPGLAVGGGATPGLAVGTVGFPDRGAVTGVICLPAGSFWICACCAGVSGLVALDGKPAPGTPLVGVTAAVALGIGALNGGIFFGGGTILGLPRLASACLTLATGRTGGRRCPRVRAGGWIFPRAAVRVRAAWGARTFLMLTMLFVLLMMVLLMTVWLILVTREI